MRLAFAWDDRASQCRLISSSYSSRSSFAICAAMVLYPGSVNDENFWAHLKHYKIRAALGTVFLKPLNNRDLFLSKNFLYFARPGGQNLDRKRRFIELDSAALVKPPQ